jgi:hypothetical protein
MTSDSDRGAATMDEPETHGSSAHVKGSNRAAAVPVIDEAGRRLRAPWAASVAGLLFSIMFTAALVLVRTEQDQTSGSTAMVVGGLYLAPFAGIMFLWFIAVVRDQIGEREDRFFATVFFGSGILFVALLFTTAAVVSTPAAIRDFGDGVAVSAEGEAILRGLGYTLLFALSTRAAAVFMIATATIGIRSGTFPRWFTLIGYLLGLVLLFAVSFVDWFILILPAWVAVTSVFILQRERASR